MKRPAPQACAFPALPHLICPRCGMTHSADPDPEAPKKAAIAARKPRKKAPSAKKAKIVASRLGRRARDGG